MSNTIDIGKHLYAKFYPKRRDATAIGTGITATGFATVTLYHSAIMGASALTLAGLFGCLAISVLSATSAILTTYTRYRAHQP